MGFRPLNITKSEKLAQTVRELSQEDWEVSDFCDMTSTAGYDNDGSTGPDLVDNGVGLGLQAMAYAPRVTVFFAFVCDEDGEATCYYQYGKDEDDAVRRLREACA